MNILIGCSAHRYFHNVIMWNWMSEVRAVGKWCPGSFSLFPPPARMRELSPLIQIAAVFCEVFRVNILTPNMRRSKSRSKKVLWQFVSLGLCYTSLNLSGTEILEDHPVWKQKAHLSKPSSRAAVVPTQSHEAENSLSHCFDIHA